MQHFSTSVLFKAKFDNSITDDELEILYLEGWIVLNTFSTKKYDKKCWYDYIWKNQFILKVFLSVIVQAIRRDWIIRMMSLSALIFNAVIKPSIKLDIHVCHVLWMWINDNVICLILVICMSVKNYETLGKTW